VSLTRRRFLTGAAGVAAGGAAVGVAACGSSGRAVTRVPRVALGPEPAGLPVRQHAWVDYEARDSYGNPVSPRFDRLLYFDVNGSPGPDHARMLEAALRTLERTFPWSHEGLLFTAGWAPSYFESVLGVASPIPRAKRLSDFELPSFDDYHLILHLASDDEDRLAAIEGALLHGEALTGGSGSLQISDALTWRETRTGFTGAGLPAANQNVGGIPSGNHVPKSSPLFMGFKSGLKKNQATEDGVTIADGQFADGTTMHNSYMRLRLSSWYENLSESERVARMYAPQMTPAQVNRVTTDAESDPGKIDQAINHYGVIGHSQASATARRKGKPRIIRRDFDTTDGGQAGVHFVSVQQTIEDFVLTRTAMNQDNAPLQNPEITSTVNNGINEFIFVLKRGNYLLPPRPQRSFPLLPGRATALPT
jgi:dye decolorizing peroxidase